MKEVLQEDLNLAVENVLDNIEGISSLYPIQLQLLSSLVKQDNIFLTAPTNAGKTLPVVILPQVVEELNKLGGYGLPHGKVLFVTALNSIQLSMLNSMRLMGIKSAALTTANCEEVLDTDVDVIFISPEIMRVPQVTRSLLTHRHQFMAKVIDEAHLVASWGIGEKNKKAFRPAMSLASGQLSAIGGNLLLMTATATAQTRRLLMDQLPEIRRWNFILHSPMREDITIVVPPPEAVSPRFEVALEPFVERMRQRETYLILVRGINKGTSVFIHLVKMLGLSVSGNWQVAFFHRNTSEPRKAEILEDLKRPMDSPTKKFLAVVATVSLGVGVDIRVHRSIHFGLAASMEALLQEGGRVMRGGHTETTGKQGYSFFLHKGALESKHCPSSSDCRALIEKDGSMCHRKVIGKFYDEEVSPNEIVCTCCYICIKAHAQESCSECKQFLDTFFPVRSSCKLSRSVSNELKCALKELFAALSLKEVKVEANLCLTVSNFISDFIKVMDEIQSFADIVRIWHVSPDVAGKVMSIVREVLHGDEEYSDSDLSGSLDEEYLEDLLDEETDEDSSDEEYVADDDGNICEEFIDT